jgi:integral membrane protein
MDSLRSPLTRYRIMAYIVGTMLIILVCVAVPIQYAAGEPTLAQVVSPIHGILYMAYLVTVWDLVRRGGFTRRQVAAMVGSGFIPGLAFVVERRVTRAATAAAQQGGDPAEVRDASDVNRREEPGIASGTVSAG